MDKLEMYVIRNGKSSDITEYLSGAITNEGEFRSCCRTLDFSIKKNTASLGVGHLIRFVVNNRPQFYGVITSRSQSTDEETVSFACKDYGMYLKRNSGTYKFKNATPKSIADRICKDFNIPHGWFHDLNTRVTRNFINVNLYNIIMTCYTLNSDKKFVIQSLDGQLRILERGTVCKKYILGDNLISCQASEDIDSMVNTVNIYNHEDKLIKTIKNDTNRKLYGQFNEYIKIISKDEKTDYIKEANKKLKGVEQKVSVGCLGNHEFITGRAVIVETPSLGINAIKGKYHIDADTHTWENGIYTNKLTLNLQCIMDEMEDGELEESKSYKKTTTKKKATTSTTKKTTTKKTTTKKSTKKEDYSVYTNRLKK